MTVYLDNAATTAPAPEVVEAVVRTMRDGYGNPSSRHGRGAAAARALAQARQEVAALIGAEPEEVIFTGSGTEADALGVVGAARAARGRHLVVSALEHAAVYESARQLASEGWRMDEVAPAQDGRVTVDSVLQAIRPDTSLVAIMLANNEIGSLQPVPDLARAVRAQGQKIHFHVDAVQCASLLPIDVRGLGVDSLALSAHKLHGPQGVGALWLRPGKRITALYGGGGQEHNLRPGTENLPGCVGFGVAASLARGARDSVARVASLRDQLEDLVFARLPQVRPTIARTTPRVPHISNVLLPGVPAEPVLHALAARSVFASEGAACRARTRAPSRVMRAIAVPSGTGTLRFSLSRFTTPSDIEAAVSALVAALGEIEGAAHICQR